MPFFHICPAIPEKSKICNRKTLSDFPAIIMITSLLGRKQISLDFPGSPVVRTPSANVGDTDSNPGLGRFHKL